MSITQRVKRSLVLGAAGAMVLSLLPAGIAAANTVETDGSAACEGSAGLVDFNDALGFFSTEIECMAAYGITQGDDEGNFDSTGNVTRQQMAQFIARLATQATSGDLEIAASDEDAFDDIAGINADARDAINFLASFDPPIVAGVGDGDSYNPGGNVTRQQMASFIARAHEALGVDFSGNEDPIVFPDADDIADVHAGNIDLLTGAGIVAGRNDGTFGPGADITRGQMSSFIVRSIVVLDNQDLWNGEFTVALPTNQTFTVTADEKAVPEDGTVEFTADVGDAEEVTIWLLDEDAVEVDDDGTVTFDTDDDGIPATADDAIVTSVDDLVITPNVFTTVSVDDGEVVFTAETGDAADEIVAVVTAGDEDEVLEEEGLISGEDGLPGIDFGVSEVVTFADIDALLTVPGANFSAVAGTSVDVTASLADAGGDTVPVDGQQVRWRVYDITDDGAPGTWDASDPDTDANFAFSGTATTVDGEVTITLDGSAVDENDEWEILIRANLSDPYTGVIDGAEGPGLQVTWTDEITATGIEWVEDTYFGERGEFVTMQAEATDAFGDPVAGARVEFSSDALIPTLGVAGSGTVRVANADGIATITVQVPDVDGDIEDLTAEVVDADDDSLDPAVTDTGVTLVRYVLADADDTIGASKLTEANAFNTDAGWVHIQLADAGDVDGVENNDETVRVNYTGADEFQVLEVEDVAQSQWVTFLEDTMVEDDADFTFAVTEANDEYTYILDVALAVDTLVAPAAGDDEVVVTPVSENTDTEVEGLTQGYFAVTVEGVARTVTDFAVNDINENVYTLTISGADLEAGDTVVVTVGGKPLDAKDTTE